MSTTKKVKPRFINYKEFANHIEVKNHTSVKKRYKMYLFIAGKNPLAKLTCVDILNIDNIQI